MNSRGALHPGAALRVPGETLLLKLLRAAPFEPQRLVLERLLRDAYPDAVRDGAFDALRGRWLRVEVVGAQGSRHADDAPGWNVTLGREGLLLSAGPVWWDVRIAASIDDFVLLANQQADPDTLFFQRRLVIEGDTELGLVVKNLIFGNELAGLPATIARSMLDVRGLVEQSGGGLPSPARVFAAVFEGFSNSRRSRQLDAGRRASAAR